MDRTLPSACSRSKRSRSSWSGSSVSPYAPATVRIVSGGSSLRSADTQFWSTFAAVGGAPSPQSWSTITSRVRVSFACRSRKGQHGALLRAAERELSLPIERLERPEDAVVHRGSA